MRWIFLDPLNPQEATYRAEKNRQIAFWWSEFSRRVQDFEQLFSGKSQWDLPEWMGETLQAIDQALMWEFGPAVKGAGHRLVITPEARHDLRPLVHAILARAPKLPGWEFYSRRLPETLEMAARAVSARSGGDITGAKARAQVGADGKIDLLFCLPTCSQPGDEQQLSHAFVAAESLLGEETLDVWIGAIEVEPMPKSGFLGMFRTSNRRADLAHLAPLDQLRPTVEALIQDQIRQLPTMPCWKTIDAAKWSVCELQPETAEDFARRDDLLFAVAARADVWEASLRGSLFHSSRFSRCGETFCYVKLDRSNALDGDSEKYLDREPFENALNAKLTPAGLGVVIGGGTGLRYSYMDLALTDMQRGVATAREVLREMNVPLRTWIQFFDDEMASEWVGVHSDAPPPPGL